MFNKKILCIGNTTVDTDIRTTELAVKDQTINHGMMASADFVPQENGYYHTTVSDIPSGFIIQTLGNHFDCVVLLDQPKSSYPHPKEFLMTFRMMQSLESAGVVTNYRDNESVKGLLNVAQSLKENKSFCGYPFLLKLDNFGYTTACPKASKPITKVDSIVNWQTDPKYGVMRDKMLAGIQIPENCRDCYLREAVGIESTRMYETLEWAALLDFDSLEDFKSLTSPAYYEIRPSNKCNLMCRMCDPLHSHLIEKEFKKIEIKTKPSNHKFQNLPFDKVDLPNTKRIYVAGGEPTIMPEVFDFAQKCIDVGITDFEFNFGTSGMKFSDKLMNLLDHFPNVTFSISFDGYKRVNDYIRWLSDFDTIVKNAHLAMSRGHSISLQTVPSIYNASRLHELFEFYDREFPNASLLLQPATDPYGVESIPEEMAVSNLNVMSAYNRPDVDVCLESLIKCTKTNFYYNNGRSLKTVIDSLIEHYSSSPVCDLKSLSKFFEFNDQLDKSRNSKLGDYIPELENCRKYIL